MCDLDAKSIDIMLKNLKENQDNIKKEYTERIDKLEKKIVAVNNALNEGNANI